MLGLLAFSALSRHTPRGGFSEFCGFPLARSAFLRAARSWDLLPECLFLGRACRRPRRLPQPRFWQSLWRSRMPPCRRCTRGFFLPSLASNVGFLLNQADRSCLYAGRQCSDNFKGGQFRSLAEPWADTGTSTGRLMIAVLGGLADVERDLIRTRTAESRSRAKALG